MLMMPYKEDCLSQPYCQMTSIRQVVFFISVFTTVATLKCYSDVVNGDDMPVGTTNCTLSKYCAKDIVEGGGLSLKTYGCGTLQCSANGCTSPSNGITTCCCDKDLCNTSSTLSLFLTFIAVIVAKLYAF
ncbi:hypothetical protein V3C99_007496 [Haemonchus contortus]